MQARFFARPTAQSNQQENGQWQQKMGKLHSRLAHKAFITGRFSQEKLCHLYKRKTPKISLSGRNGLVSLQLRALDGYRNYS